jgi:tetratricopeptide (TPR) repeat protein
MEARERSYALGDRNLGSLASADLGFLALQEGDLSQAHIYLEEALAIAREVGNKESIATRLAELGNTFYLEGKIKEFKRNYRESCLLGKELGILSKRGLLGLVLNSIHQRKPESSAQILGAIYNSLPPTHPLWKPLYDRPETHVRQVLGDSTFDAAFAKGEELSLDQALELAEKMVEEM